MIPCPGRLLPGAQLCSSRNLGPTVLPSLYHVPVLLNLITRLVAGLANKCWNVSFVSLSMKGLSVRPPFPLLRVFVCTQWCTFVSEELRGSRVVIDAFLTHKCTPLSRMA